MSRIAVVTSSPPMAEGGHLVIARSLIQALREAGHDADLVITPQNRFGRQGAAYVATWLTDVGMGLGGPIDQVISLRYPSYAVRHERHVCWLNHTMREYYDLWPRFSGRLSPQGRLKEGVRRRLIHAADRYLLTRNVHRLFTISARVKERLAMWPSLRATVLHPPAPQRAYRCEEYGDFVFLVSRLTPLKRADLVIEALASRDGACIRAVIAGEGDDRARLEQLAVQHGVSDRVTFAGAIGEGGLVDYLARCRAVCFPPLDEDYGFVTAEAFASRKAVVTCADSGGPTELVEDGVHGFVVQPTPSALGARLRELMEDAALAERLGGQAHARGAALTWSDAVRRLTET
jgi:glycosyltransferase involved in cell wall biosynthesis